jgi:threonine dehydratase
MVLSAIEILKAKRTLAGIAVRTPLTRSAGLSNMAGAEVYLKWENQQRTGAYKFRGAYNKICSLSHEERDRGVITASSGNHALAVSLASKLLEVGATVVVPTSAPKIKIERCRELGANLVISGANFDESLVHCMELARETGAIYVPGTEDHKIMAGQGTIACEILEDMPDTTAIIAPIGGGGLISGVGAWAKTVNPNLKLVGAQSTAARAMYESLRAKRVVEIPVVRTLADGLAGQISQFALDHVSKYVDETFLAEEAGLDPAIRWILSNERQVIEGSGAVGPALILQRKISFDTGDRVAVVITGGNIDMGVLGLDTKT